MSGHSACTLKQIATIDDSTATGGDGSSLGDWNIEEFGVQGQVTYPIEQGQAGLRFLSLCALATSCLNSVLVYIGYHGPDEVPSTEVGSSSAVLTCTLATFELLLALGSSVFEFELCCMIKVRPLGALQDFLLDHMPCLADVYGRGLFYLLQGMIWIIFSAAQAELPHLVVGVWLIMVGIFDFMVHCNVLPRRVLAKTRKKRGDRELTLDSAEDLESASLMSASSPGSGRSPQPLRAPRGPREAAPRVHRPIVGEPVPPLDFPPSACSTPRECTRENTRETTRELVASSRGGRAVRGARQAELREGTDEVVAAREETMLSYRSSPPTTPPPKPQPPADLLGLPGQAGKGKQESCCALM